MSFVLSVYVTEVKETAVNWTFWKYCVHTDIIIGPFINEFFFRELVAGSKCSEGHVLP